MTTLEYPNVLQPCETMPASARADDGLSREALARESEEFFAAANEIISNTLSADSEAYVALGCQPVGQ